MPLPNIFRPKKNYQLIRIGNKNDGGYLIGNNSVHNSTVLISLGINDDWGFEKNFKKIKNISCYAFDNQLSTIFLIQRLILGLFSFPIHWNIKKIFNRIFNLIEFVFFKNKIFFYKKKNISYGDLNKILKQTKSKKIFLKIDIEGSEYRMLQDILKNQKKLLALIIEFHDVEVHLNLIKNFIKKLNLHLVHIHPNNFGGKSNKNNPLIIEMSFEKNPIILSSKNKLPNKLDMKCNPKSSDIKCFFYD